MKKGFYVCLGGKEYFMVTDKVNITDRVATDFINHIQNHLNMSKNIDSVSLSIFKRKMRKAYLTYRTTQSGYKYIDIYNDDFGGYGDENTVIFE